MVRTTALAIALLLGIAGPAGAQMRLGLSDQSSAPFADPRVAELGIRDVRLVVAWNAALVPAEEAATAPPPTSTSSPPTARAAT